MNAELFAAPAPLPERIVAGLRNHGVLTASGRADDLRRAILDAGMQCVVFGHTDTRRAATYADAFALAFGEPLVPKTQRAPRRST